MTMSLPGGYASGRNITHVVDSMASSLGAAVPNTLQLPAAKSGVLLMVDGLGLEQLETFSAHAPFLRSRMLKQRPDQTELSTIYPSTTAAALASFGTGLSPGQHGVVGYDVYDPDRDTVINQLGGWDERTDPETWQPNPTRFELLQQQETTGDDHVQPVTVSLDAFEHSALTRAVLRGPRFVGRDDLAQRFHQAAYEAQQPGALIYLYVNELDRAGHKFGPGSAPWLEVLEEVDSLARRMCRRLPESTLAALTADHGMIEVSEDDRLDFSVHGALVEYIAHTAGEPRLVQLHFQSDATVDQQQATLDAWQRYVGQRAWVVERDTAVQAGWFGAVDDRVKQRIGDLLIVGREPVALYDGRRATPQSFLMVGHHGSVTSAETRVPWLLLTNH